MAIAVVDIVAVQVRIDPYHCGATITIMSRSLGMIPDDGIRQSDDIDHCGRCGQLPARRHRCVERQMRSELPLRFTPQRKTSGSPRKAANQP